MSRNVASGVDFFVGITVEVVGADFVELGDADFLGAAGVLLLFAAGVLLFSAAGADFSVETDTLGLAAGSDVSGAAVSGAGVEASS